MPNTKITDLTDLEAQAGDEIPVNRSGSDGKVTAGEIAALATGQGAADEDTQIIAGSGLTGGGTLAADRTLNVGAGDGVTVAADEVAVDVSFDFQWTGNHNFGDWFDVDEITEPANPAANKARLFVKDNGSGKTQLCVLFPTGSVTVIATED